MGAWILAAALLAGVGLDRARAADGSAETKKHLLELTGGKRVKVVWNQNKKVMFYDTKTGVIEALPLPPDGSAPLISMDGRRVFISAGKAPDNRAVYLYDTENKKVTELAKGPGNNLLAVWRDPKTKKDWVYVNSTGDFNEPWNQARGGAIRRFPADKPEARELFWDRTSSHIYLMFSEDGTRACFEPSWENIGSLHIVYKADGAVDQEKSSFKKFGAGCFPGLAPDNSYRLFRLGGGHRHVEMQDADGSNLRKVVIDAMLKERNIKGNTWLTSWSKHPRYMTLIAPAGKKADVWIGRFDKDCTQIEAWVRVSEPGAGQCWQSQAWVEN